MNIKQLIAAGMLVAAPIAALAQQSPARAAVLNPAASVPAPAYNSAFEQYPSAAAGEEDVTPDKAWRSANAQVAGDDAAPVDHSKMNHGTMDHSKMNHGAMDHSKMNHGKPDHSKMDHSKMNHAKPDHSKPDHSKPDHSKPDHSKMDHSKMDHSKHNQHEGKE